MKIEVKHERDYSPLPGRGNAEFYGYLYVNYKRVGIVWKFNDGSYLCNEDFNSRKHNLEKRPRQFKGNTLCDLKDNIYMNW